ncbi:MAG: hypothetical protein K0R25_1274 [Rickettsiaceae bacterium]|jgi:low affinity Fe/Cu permease|nr:hypothetical protein [Rickettsiaceae bacterium]
MSKKNKMSDIEKLAVFSGKFAGSTPAFITALLAIIIWLMLGPFFNYSDTWQLVINTTTSIVTFLMVFLIQRSQNKDSSAIHLKLNELIASLKGPSNRLVDVEHMSEEELRILSKYFTRLSKMASKERDISESHSIEKAKDLNLKKEIKR